jgi:hypothetical protein
MNRIILSPEYIPNPDIGRPIANGYIYIGEPDTDPEIALNQKQISVKQECGNVLDIAQPLRTGQGGVFDFNGSPVTAFVDGNYSMKILDSNMSQVYYVPCQADPEEGISVTWYGASPTATAAVNQAAFEAALTAHDTVFIPPGNFDITGELYFTGSTTSDRTTGKTLYGAGVGSTSVTITTSVVGIYAGNSALTANVNKNMSLRDFEIIGGTYGLQLGTATSPLTYVGSVNRMRVRDGSAGGIYLYQAQVYGEDVECVNTGNNGMRSLGTGGANTNCTFVKCRFVGNTGAGISLAEGSGISFIGCDFESNQEDGAVLQKVTACNLTQITFDKCWFENNLLSGSINRASLFSGVAGDGTYPNQVNVVDCEFRSVNGANLHIDGPVNILNGIGNNFLTPGAGAAVRNSFVNAVGSWNDMTSGWIPGSMGKMNIFGPDSTDINGPVVVSNGSGNAITVPSGHIVLNNGNLSLSAGSFNVGGGISRLSRADATPTGTANTVYDDLVLGSDTTANTGMTIFGTGQTGIAFADAGSSVAGQVRYVHTTPVMEFISQANFVFSGGDILPNTTNTQDLGSPTKQFQNIYSQNAVTVSDAKLKINIVDATPKHADVMKLKVRNFEMLDDPGVKVLGLIADEVEKIFPSWIIEIPDYEEVPDPDWEPKPESFDWVEVKEFVEVEKIELVKDNTTGQNIPIVRLVQEPKIVIEVMLVIGEDGMPVIRQGRPLSMKVPKMEKVIVPAQTEEDRPIIKRLTGTFTKAIKTSILPYALTMVCQEMSAKIEALEAK